MGRALMIIASMFMVACAGAPKKDAAKAKVDWSKAPVLAKAPGSQMPVYYAEPGVRYRKVCRIEASGGNFVEVKYRQMSDFEGQFKRRARKCKGANAVIIQNMFAFEHGSAFADGVAIAIEPES